MQDTRIQPTLGTDGVHAETRTREPSFVMKGHHCHSCYELFYVENGSCRFLIEDNIFDLQAGDFILVPPMALHYTRYVAGACRRTVILFRAEDVLDEVRRDRWRAAYEKAKQLAAETPLSRIFTKNQASQGAYS